MSYFYYNANPEGKSEPDCTVRAISFLLQQSWDKTFYDICAVAKEMSSKQLFCPQSTMLRQIVKSSRSERRDPASLALRTEVEGHDGS